MESDLLAPKVICRENRQTLQDGLRSIETSRATRWDRHQERGPIREFPPFLSTAPVHTSVDEVPNPRVGKRLQGSWSHRHAMT